MASAHGAQRSGVGYEPPTSNVRQKFTGKERDGETGLDYFLARYYSSIQGRFTSPDEFSGGPEELYDFADTASDNPTFYADLHDPQSLNKYQYCYNDPLNNIDPDGHSVWTKIAKFVYKAARKGDVVAAGKDVAEDAITVASPGKSIGERVFAAVSLVSEISPVSISDVRDTYRLLKPLAKKLENTNDLKRINKIPHGNTSDDRPATLYEKYDKDGSFLKHGVTKHEDPTKRYTKKQLAGGTVVATDRGPRREMLKKERDLVERRPGIENREPWAGRRREN